MTLKDKGKLDTAVPKQAPDWLQINDAAADKTTQKILNQHFSTDNDLIQIINKNNLKNR
jgi:hypothetical protein